MDKFIKNISKWFKKTSFTNWISKVFKYQLGKLISIIYEDAIESVKSTIDISNLILDSVINISELKIKIEKDYGINISLKEIDDILEGNGRTKFYIAKRILIKKLIDSKREYREYIVDTVIQLAYSYIKEKQGD